MGKKRLFYSLTWFWPKIPKNQSFPRKKKTVPLPPPLSVLKSQLKAEEKFDVIWKTKLSLTSYSNCTKKHKMCIIFTQCTLAFLLHLYTIFCILFYFFETFMKRLDKTMIYFWWKKCCSFYSSVYAWFFISLVHKLHIEVVYKKNHIQRV